MINNNIQQQLTAIETALAELTAAIKVVQSDLNAIQGKKIQLNSPDTTVVYH